MLPMWLVDLLPREEAEGLCRDVIELGLPTYVPFAWRWLADHGDAVAMAHVETLASHPYLPFRKLANGGEEMPATP